MSETPEHYSTGGITPWDYCAAKFAESFDDHLLITAVEYISRARHKAGAEDVRKAYNNLGHWLKRNEPKTQPEPQPEPADDGKRYRVETWSKEHEWQWWSDWDTLEQSKKAADRAGAMYPRVHVRIVAEHKPKGGAA